MNARRLFVFCLAFAVPAGAASAATLVRSASGANTAAIQATVDQFRADLGGMNPNIPGSFASGRREINWDGVPDNLSAPNALPADFFNVNSPRGVIFSTPGTGFEVSADSSNPTTTPVRFGHIDPSYPNLFGTFSSQRLFTARGSTVTDVHFFVPGSTNSATVAGFGVVFTDVDSANVSSIELFDLAGASMGTFFAPAASGNQTFSFVGVSFNAGERVTRVRITSGNQVLAPGNTGNDVVVMDDFIYGEPAAIVNVNSGEAFASIQAAIDDANTLNSHVIDVQPGTYGELVTVSKTIVLRGAKAGVDARDASRGVGESIVNGSLNGSNRRSAFRITADGVTIDGFTIQDQTDPNEFGAGIVMAPGMSSAQIRNNIIRNNVAGLFLSNDHDKAPTIIERNVFSGNNQPGPVSGTAIYTDQFVSGGTLLNVFVNENTFADNNNVAVLLGATTAGTQSRIVISNNIMTSNGNAILLFNTTDALVTRNNITASVGSQVLAGGGVTRLSITENYIENGVARGIRIGDFGGGGTNSSVVINCNSIQGNFSGGNPASNVGLEIDALAGSYTGTLDATGNWWGSATGPTHPNNPGGSGQRSVDPAGQVNFSDFLPARTDQQPTGSGFECTLAAILYGIDLSNNLVRFDSTSPATILSSVPITGLEPGENILGIDFRPTTGELFAVGASERLYVIDVVTAAATLRANLTAAPGDDNPFTVFNGLQAGVDFNPVPDLAGNPSLRVITSGDDNLRINVSNGQVITDTNINPAGLAIHASAYRNVDLDPATGTALFGYDYPGDQFVSTPNANAGTYAPIGPSGIFAQLSPDLDVQTFGTRNVGFAEFRTGAGPSKLYIVDLNSGLLVPLGDIGSGLHLEHGMAVAPPGFIQFALASASTSEVGPATATIAVNRVGGREGTVTVRFRTQDGTATASADYTSVDEVVTFAPGETVKFVSVPIVNDSEDEGDETINLSLSEPTGGASLLAPLTAVLTISGNDETTAALNMTSSGATTPGGQITFSASIAGGANATGTVTFNVYGPDDTSCSAPAIFTSTVPVNGDGTYTSAAFTPARTGTYRFVASYSGDANNVPVAGTCGDPTGAVTVNPATVLANIATRLRVETGENVLIGGFIVTGTLPKRLIVRAIGPSLGIAGQLENPQLEMYNGSGELFASNDNWQDAPNAQEIVDSTIPPTNDLESAFLGTLPPGNYTAVVSGVNGSTGIGVVEAYDLDRSVDSKFANIATRGFVQTGDDVLIGGLIILGDTAQRVLLRAIGPSLPVDGKLADPTLELVDGNGQTLATNDNWKSDQQPEIEATTIPPSDELESAILMTLAPAPYTAILRSVNDTPGVALIEVYALQ